MRAITKIIVHCSDTPARMDLGARDIRLWHVRDNGWNDIGYHGVIKRDGMLESGRPMNQAGAHTAGHNRDSIGVCLVGGRGEDGKPEANFTEAQWKTLEFVVRDLLRRYPEAKVYGHNDFSGKACPCFNVAEWWSRTGCAAAAQRSAGSVERPPGKTSEPETALSSGRDAGTTNGATGSARQDGGPTGISEGKA